MTNEIVKWLTVLALVAAPAQMVSAQEELEGGDIEEVEMWEGGGGPGYAEMRAQRRAPGAKKAPKTMRWQEEGAGENRMTVKVHKMLGGGMNMKARSFMSEEETLALIKKHDAAFAKKVEDYKTTAPAKYKMVMRLSGRTLAAAKLEEDASVEKDAVRTLALEFEVKEISRKMEKASDSEKAGIKEALKVKLSEVFDLRSKAQELRVKRMDASLSKLKAKLEARKAKKAKIVEQRVEELTGEGNLW